MAQPQTLLARRYRLVRPVGSGGMGIVWEAWDERLERRVAVKQLKPQPGLAPEDVELAKNRAMREARITARLEHPNAVSVFDVVEHEGRPCLVMQFVPSVPLSGLLREQGVLDVPEAARIGAEVAAALTAAHRIGIVHRDVKPGNVLVGSDRTAMISDFGISHALGDATLTSTGLVNGTPAYLAPEVARGGSSTPASDVFSLGATIFAAVEGTPPFGTDANSMALLFRVASGEHAPPRRAGQLTPVLAALLRTDPEVRPSMGEAAARLAEVATGIRPRASTPAPLRPARPFDPAPRPDRPAPTTWQDVPPASPVSPSAAREAAARVTRRPAGRRRVRAWPVVLVLLLGLVVGVAIAARELGSGAGQVGSAGPDASASSRGTGASSSSSTASATGSPSASELEDAITGYYALLPDGTDEAWPRLTATFQRDKARGRASFDAFWGGIDAVSTENVQAEAPSQVDATIVYRRRGTTTRERTSFRLVREDGILKIADSTVIRR